MLIIKRPIGTCAYMGGVPCNLEKFTWSWGQMVAHCYEYVAKPGEIVYLDKAITSYHEAARNMLAARMLGDWIWMTDTDHEFEPDIVARMVGLTKKWDVDVLTAAYRYKEHPYKPNLFLWDEPSKSYIAIAELDWSLPLQEIGAAGAGCLLVRRCAFDRIRKELGEEPFDCMPSLVNPKRNYSEDFSFFTRCRLLGIKAYVSPMIESSHLRVHGVTHADYDSSAVETQVVLPATAAGPTLDPAA